MGLDNTMGTDGVSGARLYSIGTNWHITYGWCTQGNADR